jgi:lipopolysaccharide biosynthesis glycosyltransferase
MDNLSANVCLTIDNNYVQHAAVTLTSLFLNNDNIQFNVFIIYSDISQENQVLLAFETSKYKAKIEFLLIDKQKFQNAVLSFHFTIAIYYRLLIAEILPKNISKVIYLDADLIFRARIDTLLNMDVWEYSHIAVENPRVSNETKLRLGLGMDSKYFNAGVLIINLDYWRTNEISKKCLLYLSEYKDKIKMGDQDVLNVVLENKWLQLPYTWNAQEAFFVKSIKHSDFHIAKDEHNEIVENPKIIHYTGSNKPWFRENNHLFKSEYYKYLAYTSWKAYKPISIKPSFKHRIVNKILRGFKKITKSREK